MPKYIKPKRAWWISDEHKWKYFRDNGTQIPIDRVDPFYLLHPNGTFIHDLAPNPKTAIKTVQVSFLAIRKRLNPFPVS